MKVIVCGGRHYSRVAFLWRKLDELHAARPFTGFMQGGARGADLHAKAWARSKPELAGKRYTAPADWERYGKQGGPLRNARMMTWPPDLVVAFPGGHGTRDMVVRARRAGIEVIEFGD